MQQSRPHRLHQRLLEQRGLPSATPASEDSATLPLNATDILIAEYDYAAKCAFQAHEDRARVSSYYLVSAGTAVAAILGGQSEEVMPTLTTGFAAIFVVLFGIGFLTLLQLIRLRQAWYDSALAMNRIKEYYQKSYPQAELSRAFAWTSATLPPPGKLWSIAFLLAFSVILIDACAAAGAIIFWGYSTFGDDLLYRNWAIGVALALVVLQIILYRLLLRKKSSKDPRGIEEL